MIARRVIVILIWTVIIFLILYAYFFRPDFFRHLFEYPGPGSPYVNPPAGAIFSFLNTIF